MRQAGIGLAVLLWLGSGAVRAEDWPQWLGTKRDGVWREAGLIDRFPNTGPKVLWRTPIGGGYAGPAVSEGKVYVTDRELPAGVTVPESGFKKSRTPGKERILCLDAQTGQLVWKQEYDCTYEVQYPLGPRTTPVVRDGRVYTLGAMGDLLCLDIKDGRIVWHKKLIQEYGLEPTTWGFAAHPLLDGDRLICLVGGPGSTVVAFHKDTGKEIWRALSASEPGYAPPMLYDIGGTRQLIVWTPAAINSLNPETGKVYWSQPFGGRKGNEIQAGLTVASPRLEGDLLLVTAFYEGAMMLKLKGTEKPSILWRSKSRGERPDLTDGLHSIIPTPFFKDGYIYGVCSYGELRCLKADTGERIWETHQATTGESTRWGNAFLVPQGDRCILFNERGDLIIAKLTPKGYEEISRANILAPTNRMPGRFVVWSHPAFANRCVYARNDREIVCVSMAK